MPRRLCDVCPYGCHWILSDMKWILCIGGGRDTRGVQMAALERLMLQHPPEDGREQWQWGGRAGAGDTMGWGWHVGPGTCTHHRGASPPWHNATGHLLWYLLCCNNQRISKEVCVSSTGIISLCCGINACYYFYQTLVKDFHFWGIQKIAFPLNFTCKIIRPYHLNIHSCS